MNGFASERIVVEVLNGGLRVVLGQDVVTHFRSRKHAALLAYLACHGTGKRHGRGALADLLWPESSPAAARASLCEAISSLRTQIEPAGIPRGSVILADRSTVAISTAVETDYETLSSLLIRANHADARSDRGAAFDLRMRAIGLFRDFLLPELREGWLLEVQARLSAQIAEAECALAAHFLRLGDRRNATVHAQKAFALDEYCPLLSSDLEALVLDSDSTSDDPDLHNNGRSELPAATVHRNGKRDRRAVERQRPGRQHVSRSVSPAPPPLLPLLAPVTRLFGRDIERQQLASLLRDIGVRLITLAGPGGIGKTRLAVAAAQDFAKADPLAKVWFVQMAAVVDETRLCEHLHRAVSGNAVVTREDGLEAYGGRESLSQILNASRETVLLVLDNLEQIAEAAGDLILFLLGRVPGLTCLVTSRQRLLRPGEHWLPVDPLPTPPASYPVLATDLDEFVRSWPSVGLFVDRARQSAPNFRLTSATVGAVAELVAELEGIPLAIELAAARSLLFTPRQMHEQVNRDRFRLLVNRQEQRRRLVDSALPTPASAKARHSSLIAAITWSHSLLSEAAQSLLASLAIFRDGFTIAGVIAVILGDSDDVSATTHSESQVTSDSLSRNVSDLLEQLCHASFLRADRPGDDTSEPRFTMLETIRQFAEARLSPEQAASLAGPHARYFADFAEAAEVHLQASDASRWMSKLDTEYANLSSALDWASRTATPDAARCALRTAMALHRYWLIRSSLREGRSRLHEALAHPCVDTSDKESQAAARNRAGILAMTQGDCAIAEARYHETLALYRALNDRRGLAKVLNNLAILAGDTGDAAKARALYLEVLPIWRALGDVRLTAVVLSNLGTIDNEADDLESAFAFLTESLPMARAVGDARGAAITLRNLGIVAWKLGQLKLADQRFCESLAPLKELGDDRGCAYSLLGLGLTAWKQGHQKRARRVLETALNGYAAFGQALTPFARAEIDRLAAAGFRINLPNFAPGTPAASSAIHAISVVSQVILDDWEENSSDTDGPHIVLYTHPAAAA